MKAKLVPAGHGQRVDLLFRNKKHDLVATGSQHLRDSKSREEMATGAAACDYRVHEIGPM